MIDIRKSLFIKNRFQLFDQSQSGLVIGLDLLSFQTGQSLQTHLQNRFGLNRIQGKFALQLPLSLAVVGRSPDGGDHRIDVVQSYAVTFQKVQLMLGVFQAILGSALDHIVAKNR